MNLLVKILETLQAQSARAPQTPAHAFATASVHPAEVQGFQGLGIFGGFLVVTI